MFETINSQVQQNQQALRGALTDHIGRLAAMYDEIGRLEETGLALASTTIDGSSAWLKQSFGASENLSASVRQAVEETAAQAAKPTAPLAETLGAVRKLADEHAARVATCCDEVAHLEHAGTGRMGEALDECSRLLKESLRYGAQLAAEWRKLAVEAARRTADSLTPAA
ncbi:MAG: hypothetical protein HY906_16860 [Deltaproteobacteria bacterium]|nr:hypothetical protein [Deltaproteobacteria bacterium]